MQTLPPPNAKDQILPQAQYYYQPQQPTTLTHVRERIGPFKHIREPNKHRHTFLLILTLMCYTGPLCVIGALLCATIILSPVGLGIIVTACLPIKRLTQGKKVKYIEYDVETQTKGSN